MTKITGKQISESVEPTEVAPAYIPNRKEEARRKLEKFMQEETKTVKGIFQFFESPGMATKITVRKYPGHLFEMTMTDGQEYTIPLYVARFLNGIDVTAEKIGGNIGTCSYEVHQHIMDANGLPIISHAKRKKRFGFQSLEFAGSVQ
jgi:hypothetical protein